MSIIGKWVELKTTILREISQFQNSMHPKLSLMESKERKERRKNKNIKNRKLEETTRMRKTIRAENVKS